MTEDEKQAENILSTKGTKTLVVGDSIVKSLRFDKEFVSNKAESGAKIEDIEKQVGYETNTQVISEVVVHAGTNNLYKKTDAEMEDLYISLTQQTQNLKDLLPGKQIILSAVIPMIGEGKEEHNEKARQLNFYMEKLSQREENVFFTNCEYLFMQKGQMRKNMYNDNDKTGRHLSNEKHEGCLDTSCPKNQTENREREQQKKNEREKWRHNDTTWCSQ